MWFLIYWVISVDTGVLLLKIIADLFNEEVTVKALN